MPLYTKSLAIFGATILATLFVTSNTVSTSFSRRTAAVEPAADAGAGLAARTVFTAGRSLGATADQAADSLIKPADPTASGEAQAPEPPPVYTGGGGGGGANPGGGGGGGGGGIIVGSTQQALINGDRAGSGLGALSWSGCLAGIAAQNAARIAAAGAISHADGPSRDLGCGLGSSQAGENVGYWTGGVNDGQLNSMFMASAPHRANIMGPYRYVGTAWAVAPNGTAYIAVEFA